MATLAEDDFDRADSDSLGSDWTEENGDIDIVSNRAKSTNAARASWAGTFDNADADYDIQAAVEKTGAVGAPNLLGRFADTSNYYEVQLNTFSQFLRVRKRVSGSNTTLGEYNGGYSNNNVHTIRLDMVGTALKGYEPGTTERVSVTDSDLTAAGVPGIRGENENSHFNDFIVTGDAAAAAIFPDMWHPKTNQPIKEKNEVVSY